MPPKPLSTKKNMLWNSSGSIVALACNWFTTIIVVRLSSSYEAAGLLALAMTIGNIFTPFATYKMRTYQISDVNGEFSAGQYMAFRGLTTFAAFAGCLIYALFTCQANAYLPVALYLLYKTIDQITDVMHGVDQNNGRMDYIGISLASRGVLGLASFSVCLALSGCLEVAIVAMIASNVPITVLYDYRKARQFADLKPYLKKSQAKLLLKRCFTAVLSAVFCSAVLTVPRQYLSFTLGDEALGIYASIAAPVTLVQMGATYIYMPLLGDFSERYKKSAPAFFSLLGKTTLGICAIAVISLLGFGLLGEWILALLFGDSIRPYVYLLQPAIICTIVTAYLWFLSDLLVATRNFKENFVGNLVSIIVSLLVTIPCVDIWGMNGVSFTGIAGYGAGVLVLGLSLIWKMTMKEKKAV